MIRGPKIYKGTRPAKCAADGKSLKVGENYYLATGYGSGNVATFHDRCVSDELKLAATQKEVVTCQNPACRQIVSARAYQKLKACPECGMKADNQYLEMIANNLLAETRLAILKGKLVRSKNR